MTATVHSAIADPERRATLAFLSIPGVGPATVDDLRREFGSLAEALAAGAERYAPQLLFQARAALQTRTLEAWLDQLVADCEGLGIQLMFRGDEDWPQELAQITRHGAPKTVEPAILFIRGRMDLGKRRVGVVGTREASDLGIKMARRFGETLAESEIITVSGGALGVDSAAHRGALLSRGETWCVLGTGMLEPYPAENAKLFDEIAEHGAVISEFAPRQPMVKGLFPRRNWLVAALSEPLVFVQGGGKSGAIHTVNAAILMGRTVMAVPGDPFDPKHVGTNYVLRRGGARVMAACHSTDVLRFFDPRRKFWVPANAELPQSELELHQPDVAAASAGEIDSGLEPVYAVLGRQPKHFDALASTVGWPAPQVLAALMQLEVLGLCEQKPGKLFLRRSE